MKEENKRITETEQRQSLKLTDIEKGNREMRLNIIDFEQYSRKKNLEIQQMPEVQDENVENVNMKIGEMIGQNIQPGDIKACHRTPLILKTRKSQVSWHRPIFVRLLDRKQKTDVLKAFM